MPTIKTTLRDKTLELLRERPAHLKLKDISIATGLPEGWLSMFHCDRIADPSVNYVQTLFEFLTKTRIKV